MSIEKPKRRTDVKSEIKKRTKDGEQRLKRMEKVVRDKKIEADLSKRLKLSGTSEGIKAVKKSVEAAAKETDQEFKKQEGELDREVLKKAQETEKELRQRSEQTQSDINEIGKAISQIDTKAAGGRMEAARKEAEGDRSFTENMQKRQEGERKKAEGKARKQESDIRSAKVSFRN